MSEISERNDETYSIVFRALRHPIRRKILNLLAEREMAFTEIEKVLGIDSGHLTYHLTKLQYLIATSEGGRYHLSVFGKAALNLLSNVEGTGRTFKLEEKSKSRLSLKPMQVSLLILVLAIGLIAGFYSPVLMQSRANDQQTGIPRIQQVEVVSRWVQLEWPSNATWSYNLTTGTTPTLMIVETLPSNPALLNVVGLHIKYPSGLEYSTIGVERESYDIAGNGTYTIQLYRGDAWAAAPTSQSTITVWLEITLLQIQTAK
jgi:DNA-binding transcriptional ArsR family regulator